MGYDFALRHTLLVASDFTHPPLKKGAKNLA